MNILAIDDDVTVQSIISSFFSRYASEKSFKINIKGVTDPVQAMFELSARGYSYDLITLDVRMPRLTGDDIYATLLQTCPHLLDKILFATGFGDDLKQRFPGHNFNIINKPFRYSNFKTSVETIIEQRS